MYLLYIYFALLSVCLFFVCLGVCPFVSNKRQNGSTDRAQTLSGTSHDPREGLKNIKIERKKSWKIVGIFFNAPI